MRYRLNLAIAWLCLAAAPLYVHAAETGNPDKVAQGLRQRLVLMPLRVSDDDKGLRDDMEAALVNGLQSRYAVFSGERVQQKAKEIFNRESRTSKHDCDETRCMQDIAMAFQAELIGTANVTKRDGGYFLALTIQNIFDDKVVYSQSLPCEGCSVFQVVDRLKTLGDPSAAAVASVRAPQAETKAAKPMQEGIRIVTYVDDRYITNPRKIGTGAESIDGHDKSGGSDILLSEDVAALVTRAMKDRFDEEGYRVVDGAGSTATLELSGRIKELTYNTSGRGEVSIAVESRLRDTATGQVLWSSTVFEGRKRPGGGSGGAMGEMVGFLKGGSGTTMDDVVGFVKKEVGIVTLRTSDEVTSTLSGQQPEMLSRVRNRGASN